MVSPRTEGRVLGGHYGASEHFPLIPGYIVVGEVIWVGEAAICWRVGDLVSGRNPLPVSGTGSYWGGQASHHIYPTNGDGRPVLLPVSADPLDYVVAELAAISLRGVEAAKPRRNETASCNRFGNGRGFRRDLVAILLMSGCGTRSQERLSFDTF